MERLIKKEINKIQKSCDPRDESITRPYFAIDMQMHSEERFYHIVFDAVRQAKYDAGLGDEEFASLTLFVGSTSINIPIYEDSFAACATNGEPYLKTIGYDVVAKKIADEFGIKAKSYTINTACTSSANAFASAASMIRQGKIKKAIVVGLEIYNNLTLCGFEVLQLLTKNKSKPFDKNRDGIALGELCSVVVLSSEKLRCTDFEYLGGANICDTTSVTGGDESGELAMICMQKAIEFAGVQPSDVTAVKSHATGSSINDLAEGRGLKALFDKNIPPICALKPYIGHTLGGCGVGELVLFIGCVERGFLPPALGFENVDEDIGFAPITKDEGVEQGVFLLNYFGFGGNSTALVVSNR